MPKLNDEQQAQFNEVALIASILTHELWKEFFRHGQGVFDTQDLIANAAVKIYEETGVITNYEQYREENNLGNTDYDEYIVEKGNEFLKKNFI